MEIERKYLVDKLPENLSGYPCRHIRQAYVCTDPVVRVRQKDDQYFLTIKGKGKMAREEIEMPISEESFQKLYRKKAGLAIVKNRYLIPDGQGYTVELDLFEEEYKGLIIAEVEFPDLDRARDYTPPAWFGREVTEDSRFHNSNLSSRSPKELKAFTGPAVPSSSNSGDR